MQIKKHLRKLKLAFIKLNNREQLMLVVMFFAIFITGLYFAIDSALASFSENQRILNARKGQLQSIVESGSRYKDLNSRLDKLKDSFAKSEMTFEEVTVELDSIVQKSIGNSNYELKKGRAPQELGFNFEKQQFSLKINSIELEETIKLLHSLENSKSPFLLGKVDFKRFGRKDKFSINIEIYSIRKNAV